MTINTFEECCEYIKTVNINLISNEKKLELYKYYKQITIGDCNTIKPFISLTNGYKWESWESIRGMDKQEAIEKYINLVNKFI
jgi:diazepam-binding inhibitor (GABA receptor modulating acyl-CoA-binding protein)